MADEVNLSTFQKKLEERRRRETEAKSSAPEVVESTAGAFDADLIPEVGPVSPKSNPDLDRVIENIKIVEAYRRWCGKSVVDPTDKRTEGIKVSCPTPGHRDSDPSAWLNTAKNLWTCGGCGAGGDVYDIAAGHFGYPVPGYKEGGKFLELRQKMAESMGYSFIKAPGMTAPIMVAPEDKYTEKDPTPTPPAKVTEKEPVDVTPLVDLGDDDEAERLPGLDWENLADEGTFLRTYMDICTKDDVPNEYHFWNAMLAIGFTGGRDCVLFDQTPVFSNIFLCLMGPTGDGKSRSYRHLRTLLRLALPPKWDDPNSKGVEFISSPASAEHLIYSFSKPVTDETNPKKIVYYAPVRGLIEFNELSSLTGRAMRKGNVLKPTLMEFYDSQEVVETGSRTSGRVHAGAPFGSVFTTTQPRALKDLVREGDAHSGFLNRWIFGTATPKTRVPIGGIQIDVAPAVNPLRDIQGWVGLKRMLTWSDPAARHFTQFFHEVLYPAQKSDESELLTRMDLLAKKLILLLSMNNKEKEVPLSIVEKVISMFSYLTAAYGVPAAHIGSTVSTEVQTELLRHIARYSEKKGGISLRDLNKCIKRKNFPLDLVAKTLKYMTELNMIEVFNSGSVGPGRPTVKYRMAS